MSVYISLSELFVFTKKSKPTKKIQIFSIVSTVISKLFNTTKRKSQKKMKAAVIATMASAVSANLELFNKFKADHGKTYESTIGE